MTMTDHDRAVSAGEPGYLDPRTGLFVFTAAALAERGSCCGTGCRHCPWRGEADDTDADDTDADDTDADDTER